MKWSDAERNAWRVTEVLLPSRWAEKNRVLTRRQTSRPGPWRNSNGPALIGIMDLCVRRTVQEIWIKKAGQVGVSEAIRNVIGRNAHQQPDPALIILPNEKDGRKIFAKRILPLFEDTPVLAELATGVSRDHKLTGISLSNGFDLQLAWGGSPSSIASDPFRTVILDEVDKYENYGGREANPADLATTRLRTYGEDGLLIALSTPTISSGPISQGYESCPIKLFYYVPCPHCRVYQRLIFDRLKWEKYKELPEARDRAARIMDRKAAWYECANSRCGEKILESQRRRMLGLGYWGTEDGGWKLFNDGREGGKKPEGSRIGVHYPAWNDLSTPLYKIAADYVEADGRRDKLQHLYNSTLAEEFRERVAAASLSVFAAKCRRDDEKGFVPPAAKTVPNWASRLLLTVDTQKDHFYFVVRAWGHRMRSQRIHHGRASSFQEIAELFYRAWFPYEKQEYPPLRCYKLFIDSGGGIMPAEGSSVGGGEQDASRTDQVYRFCLRDPINLLPLKGASKSFDERIRKRQITYSPPSQKREAYQVWLHLLDVGYFQDLLASYIDGSLETIDPKTGEVGAPEEQWLLNDLDDGDYNRHLSNAHKERVKSGRGWVERWIPKTSGARLDYRACEVYQIALAHGPGQCFALPSALQVAQMGREAAQMNAPKAMTDPHGRPYLATQRP